MLRSLEPFWNMFRSTHQDEWYVPTVRVLGLMVEIAIISKDGWTRMATISPEGPKSVSHFPQLTKLKRMS